jgi:ubiquinone/menaquinone biosynthesis C-methylase UbiE
MGSHHDSSKPHSHAVSETRGVVWNWARRYDLLIGLATLGRERAFRRRIADLAQPHPAETVLDVGCGTGTLAIVARERVGALGRVAGIDPSVQMIARARQKADRSGFPVDFQVGVIEHLAFTDESFDVVLSTFMMHHLPPDLKRQGLIEVARVLKPEGRLLILDLKGHTGPWKSSIREQAPLLKEAGFSHVEMGEIRFYGFLQLSFIRARKSLAEKGKDCL